MVVMDRMLRSAVFFGLLALLWAPTAIAEEPTRHIIGVRDVPAALHAIPAAGLRAIKVIPLIDAIVVEGPGRAARALAAAPFVRYVEPDPPDAAWIQEDTLPYGVHNIEAEVVWGGVPNATNVIPGLGGAGVKVAVVDTGIDCGHPDLAPNCVYGANFAAKGNKLAFDDHGHGTHVAGIIAARDNGFGVIGVAPEATLYAVKVLDATGSGPWSAVASGIVWSVKNGMNVVNMSLGGSSISQAVADAVQAASDAGILVVSAAGNSGCCDTVLYPAKLPGSMAVAAVDANDERAFTLLKRWAASKPMLADPKIELARLYEEHKEYDAAKEQLLEALTLEPNNPRALAARGNVREQLARRLGSQDQQR